MSHSGYFNQFLHYLVIISKLFPHFHLLLTIHLHITVQMISVQNLNIPRQTKHLSNRLCCLPCLHLHPILALLVSLF